MNINSKQILDNSNTLDISWSLRDLIIWFIVSIYPFIVVPNELGYFYMPRYYALAVLSTIALFLLFRDKKLGFHPVFLPLGLFMSFALISTLMAPYQTTAWMGLSGIEHISITVPEARDVTVLATRFTGFNTYVFCAILFILSFQSRLGEKLINWMIGASLIIGGISILQHFNINIVPHESFREAYHSYGTFGQPNFLGTYMTFVLPAAVIRFLQSQKRLWLFSSGVIYAGLLVSRTRGAWIAFFITFLIITVFCLTDKKKLKPYFCTVCVLLLVTVILMLTDDIIFKRALSIPNNVVSGIKLEDNAGSNRMMIWKESVKLLPQHWAFGIGPDHLIYEGISLGTSICDKVHNIYLEIAVTMGIFTLLSYMAFIIWVFRSCWKTDGFLFFLMITAYLIQGFFNIDTIMIMPLFWIVLGLTLANSRDKK